MQSAVAQLVQALSTAGVMVAVVYVPLLAERFGANGSQIGLLVAGYQATMLLANMVFGRWADFSDRRRVVVLGLALSALALAAHVLARGLVQLFVIRAVAGLALGIYPAALVAYFYAGDRKLGRFSGFGALGWGVGALLTGVVAAGWVFPMATVMMLAALAVAAAGLRPQHPALRQPFFDTGVLRRNWPLYLSFYLRHTGAHSIWAIFPVFIKDRGATPFWVGLIFAINPFGQFVFMNLFERAGAKKLVWAGLGLSFVTFVAFALARNHWQLIPIQVLLALSWSCLYLGSLKQLLAKNPEHSTAAGMFQSTFSLAAVSGGLLTGLTGRYGYPAVMLGAAGLTLVATAVFAVARE